MTDYESLKKRILEHHSSDVSGLMDCLALCVETEDHATNREIRRLANGLIKNGGGASALDLYNRTLLFDAQSGGETGRGDFDCFLRYIECERELDKRFYYPRRKTLLPIVRAFQDVHDRTCRNRLMSF